MFPEEDHQKIVARIDVLEADLYRVYRALERLRLDLQRQWRVLPTSGRWSETEQSKTEYSGRKWVR